MAMGVMILLCAGAGAADLAGYSDYDKANSFYETKDYAKAKEAYDALVSSGPWSANLFYNRGNAEWKLGDGGKAALDYERALALEPSHPQARANLEFVRDQTGAKTAEQTWQERVLTTMSGDAAAVLAAACGWVGLFCVAVAVLRREGRVGPVATLVMCVLVGAYAGGCVWEAGIEGTKAIVVAKSAQARVAPADAAPIADVLPAGSEVLAPEVRGPWTYCTLPDGTRAWVLTDAVEKVKLG
jgi:tetratricopeptide (TPR) repeat protein